MLRSAFWSFVTRVFSDAMLHWTSQWTDVVNTYSVTVNRVMVRIIKLYHCLSEF